jgi:uncharacterized repeat protein (TIGR03803 family)
MAAGVNGWRFKVLYNFQGGSDGNGPLPAPIFDRQGNLYVTTYNGGVNDGGTVFKLSPQANGQWSETVLYRFTDNGLGGADVYNPTAGLIVDASGNFYGTARKGATFDRRLCGGLGCGVCTKSGLSGYSVSTRTRGYELPVFVCNPVRSCICSAKSVGIVTMPCCGVPKTAMSDFKPPTYGTRDLPNPPMRTI